MGVSVIIVAYLGPFWMRANSPNESPTDNSARGTISMQPISSFFLNLRIVTLPV